MPVIGRHDTVARIAYTNVHAPAGDRAVLSRQPVPFCIGELATTLPFGRTVAAQPTPPREMESARHETTSGGDIRMKRPMCSPFLESSDVADGSCAGRFGWP